MIRFTLSTLCKQSCLRLAIYTHAPKANLVIKGTDPSTGNVFFKQEVFDYSNQGLIFIPLPLTPKKLVVTISSNAAIDLSEKPKLVPLKKSNLPLAYDTTYYKNLFRFAKYLSIVCSYRTPWSFSRPDNLEYCPYDKDLAAKISSQIIELDDKNKKKISSTPARVIRNNPGRVKFALIEVSQPAFKKMTVYMRYALILHELGHDLLDTKDEQVADRFARSIYFAEGFPKADYMYSFTNVFKPVKNTDGTENENHAKALTDRMDIAWSEIVPIEQKYF